MTIVLRECAHQITALLSIPPNGVSAGHTTLARLIYCWCEKSLKIRTARTEEVFNCLKKFHYIIFSQLVWLDWIWFIGLFFSCFYVYAWLSQRTKLIPTSPTASQCARLQGDRWNWSRGQSQYFLSIIVLLICMAGTGGSCVFSIEAGRV
jgi:hypothetical protein